MPQDNAPYKPSAWAIFDQVLGGRTITDARDTLIARDRARRLQEQEIDGLAALADSVRNLTGGGPAAPDPVSAEMGLLSGSMQDAPGPKTYSAPIGPGMDGEPLPGMRSAASTPPRPRVPGNIDLAARPRVKNPDGSISTISSMSFGAEDGEVLIPTIADDGRRLSEAEAIDQYRRTGRHLGIFESPDGATAFAKTLSNSQGDRIAQPRQPASLPAGPPRLPTYRDFAPIVAEAVMSGNPTVAARANALAGIFDKAGPDVEFVNGLGVDKRDSGSVGRFIPSLDKGQEPLFDSNGRIVAVRNMDGSVKAAADMAGAVTGAQELAKAGLDLIYTEADDGSAVQETRAQAVDRVTGGAVGLPALPGSTGPRAPVSPAGGAPPRLGVRQSPADAAAAKVIAEATASRQAERPQKEAVWNSQLAALTEMEALLPDVVAGFGAQPRLQLERAKAAMGDEAAQRKVAATQTFINQGRVLVAQIIKSFGSNPTEGERKFTEQMSGADAELDPKTLAEGIRLQRERIAREMNAQGGGPTTTRRPTPEEARAELKRRGLIQ